MRNKHLLLATAAVFAVTASVAANADDPIVLDGILVSGSLTPIPVSEYGRANTVITADDLKNKQTVHVADILRSVPGVSVSRTGSVGGPTQVRIRGNEGNHTLVLIDGIEANAVEGGEYDFAGLIAADIERIEVLRGPQSSLYGSNAVGGVISIITKRSREPGFSTGGRVEGGTDSSAGAEAYIRGGWERVRLSLSAAGQWTGGFDVSDDPGGEDDRDRNFTVNGRVDTDVTDAFRIGATLRAVERSSEFDGFAFGAANEQGLVFDRDDRRKRFELFGSLFGDLSLAGGRIESRASLDFHTADDETFTARVRVADTTANRFTGKAQATVAIDAPTVSGADHTLTLASDYQHETYKNNDPALVFDPSQLDEQSRSLFGIVAEYRGTYFDRLDVQGSLRHDFNDNFEDATTFAVGASFRIEETGTRLHASAGSGVQNPTFFEQFGFIPGQFIGNSDLKPEKSLGFDVGVEQRFWQDKAIVDVTVFQQSVEDEIFTSFPPPAFIGTPFNDDGESERVGVEVQVNLRPIEGLEIGMNYTFLHATDFDGSREIRRPRHEGGIVATYRFFDNRASVTADARFVADNLDSDFRNPSFGTQDFALEDYAVVNIAASFDVNEQVQVYGRIINLFDADYQELHGYAAQGLTGYAGMRIQF